MFEELAILNGSRPMLAAGICYTLWLLSGVLFREWSVGEAFFWMWWEILFSGISTAFLMYRWQIKVRRAVSPEAFNAVLGIVVSLLLGMFFATMFTAISLNAEGVTRFKLMSYVESRQGTLYVLAFLALAVHLMAAHGPRFHRMARIDIERPLMTRLFAILGVYFIMICAHHWSGSHKWDDSPRNQMIMGCGLLGTKLLLELRQFFKGAQAAGINAHFIAS